MKKIERRALVCCILAMLLAAGLCVFLGKYLLNGGSWVSSAFNRHLYNSSGVLACGTVLDRDGDVLSTVENGERTYYDNADVRRATLHAVGAFKNPFLLSSSKFLSIARYVFIISSSP